MQCTQLRLYSKVKNNVPNLNSLSVKYGEIITIEKNWVQTEFFRSSHISISHQRVIYKILSDFQIYMRWKFAALFVHNEGE